MSKVNSNWKNKQLSKKISWRFKGRTTWNCTMNVTQIKSVVLVYFPYNLNLLDQKKNYCQLMVNNSNQRKPTKITRPHPTPKLTVVNLRYPEMGSSWLLVINLLSVATTYLLTRAHGNAHELIDFFLISLFSFATGYAGKLNMEISHVFLVYRFPFTVFRKLPRWSNTHARAKQSLNRFWFSPTSIFSQIPNLLNP